MQLPESCYSNNIQTNPVDSGYAHPPQFKQKPFVPHTIEGLANITEYNSYFFALINSPREGVAQVC